MGTISLVHNTGIQFYELEKLLIIDFGQNERVMDPLYFYEYEENNKFKLEMAYYFPGAKECLRRSDLIEAGYLHPVTNDLMHEDEFIESMNWLDANNLIRLNRLTEKVGELNKSGLDQIENIWLPIPYFERSIDGCNNAPSNWCRLKLSKDEKASTDDRRVYRVILAFDTDCRTNASKEAPYFLGEPYRAYSLCGVSYEAIQQMPHDEQVTYLNRLVPLKAFDFCNTDDQPWLNRYLKNILHSSDQNHLPANSKTKHLAYYTYFISYLFNLGILPEVKLYNDEGQESVSTNLILDIGNSRTFGLVAEDPIDDSFSKAATLHLRNLDTGAIYGDPFDMRLCFKKEEFGVETIDGAFRWPSVVRLGKEALTNIYGGNQNVGRTEQYDTSYSSPKRYLWDKEAYPFQWKYISAEEDDLGPLRAIDYDGLMQQFHNDGRFAADPQKMGDKSCYSRSSLMTFCFIEIILQAKMQINSYEFRKNNGNEHRKREIRRVILTCPTAMTREEQITLRQCMEDASIVLKRFYSKAYNQPYDRKKDTERIKIIPSVSDLSYNDSQLNLRESWNYDEATCCQMVYMYSELRRYLGNANEFFTTYGHKRNGEKTSSLIVGTLDMGAGTTDIMICKYNDDALSIKPQPLFWESFKLAGDDLVKRVIVDVLLDSPQADYPNASGILSAKLISIGQKDVSEIMHRFFDDIAAMNVVDKRMRKEYLVQVLQPIAALLLERLRQGREEHVISYNDIFGESQPSQVLLDFFENHMGFRFEDVEITFSPKFFDEIIRKVYEMSMRKWAALFHAYDCDVVLLNGRPFSLRQMRQLMQRLYPVSPDRLISMSSYRVGSWYPGSTAIGHFKDNKSMVAVGALIAYLAENGKLPHFRLSTESLRTKVLPTTEYMGIINTHTGKLDSFLSPKRNEADKSVTVFPISIGAKQIDIDGYPSNLMYVVEINQKAIREEAIKRILKKNPGTEASTISPDTIASEAERILFDLRMATPLTIHFEREYADDKEKIRITSVTDSNKNTVSTDMLKLKLQTWSDESTNWLDTGIFKLRIGK